MLSTQQQIQRKIIRDGKMKGAIYRIGLIGSRHIQ